MIRWEYKQVTFAYVPIEIDTPEPESNTWRAKVSEDKEVEGIENIFNYFGEEGWEAISFAPAFFQPFELNAMNYEVGAFLAVFKRPKE